MPSYRYEATDALGKIVHGTIEAETERGARNQLRGRGLLPLSTAPTAAAKPTRRAPAVSPKAVAKKPAAKKPAAAKKAARGRG